jgi:hypothetical protein
MTFRRIALIAVSLLALSGCVVYQYDDYRQGIRADDDYRDADRHDWGRPDWRSESPTGPGSAGASAARARRLGDQCGSISRTSACTLRT